MKAVLQRVTSASVSVDKKLMSSIGRGILVFAAVDKEDTRQDAESLAAKVLKLKMWPDDNGGTWKKNVQDIQGEVLCVSQFTLLAKVKKGNKPDFHGAADVTKARELYDHFYDSVRNLCYDPERVKNGVFQAMMEVGLVNDGPVGVDYRSDDAAVTIEITSSLPKKDEKDKGGKKESGSKSDKKESQDVTPSESSDGRQVYEFHLPPSLLE